MDGLLLRVYNTTSVFISANLHKKFVLINLDLKAVQTRKLFWYDHTRDALSKAVEPSKELIGGIMPIDWNKKLQTTGEDPVTVLFTYENGDRLIGAKMGESTERIFRVSVSGHIRGDGDFIDGIIPIYSILPVIKNVLPQKIERYVCVFKEEDGEWFTGNYLYESKDGLTKNAIIAKVTFEVDP